MSMERIHVTKETSSNIRQKSQKLVSLAEQLRLYKAPPCLNKPTTQELVQESERKNDRAAVLICIFEGNEGDLRVILTKRSSKLSSFSGEVALPGGKREEGDANEVETASREAKEEIGLDPSLVEVVTVLEPFVRIGFYPQRGTTVIPVIGILFDKKAFIPCPNVNEVESVFDVPLEMFLKDENKRAEEREWMGEKFLVHFFNYQLGGESHLIWALTAGIMIMAASVVYRRPPAFLERRPRYWNGIAYKPIPRL